MLDTLLSTASLSAPHTNKALSFLCFALQNTGLRECKEEENAGVLCTHLGCYVNADCRGEISTRWGAQEMLNMQTSDRPSPEGGSPLFL